MQSTTKGDARTKPEASSRSTREDSGFVQDHNYEGDDYLPKNEEAYDDSGIKEEYEDDEDVDIEEGDEEEDEGDEEEDEGEEEDEENQEEEHEESEKKHRELTPRREEKRGTNNESRESKESPSLERYSNKKRNVDDSRTSPLGTSKKLKIHESYRGKSSPKDITESINERYMFNEVNGKSLSPNRVTPQEFHEYYDKSCKGFLQRKHEELEKKRLQKEQEELAELRDKPNLISKPPQKRKYIPLLDRTPILDARRERELEKIRKEQEEKLQKEAEELTFAPKINPRSKNMANSPVRERINTLNLRPASHYSPISNKKPDNSFQPQINPNSRNIAKTILENRSKDVVERLYYQADLSKNKKNELAKQLTPKFTPSLNKNTRKIIRQIEENFNEGQKGSAKVSNRKVIMTEGDVSDFDQTGDIELLDILKHFNTMLQQKNEGPINLHQLSALMANYTEKQLVEKISSSTRRLNKENFEEGQDHEIYGEVNEYEEEDDEQSNQRQSKTDRSIRSHSSNVKEDSNSMTNIQKNLLRLQGDILGLKAMASTKLLNQSGQKDKTQVSETKEGADSSRKESGHSDKSKGKALTTREERLNSLNTELTVTSNAKSTRRGEDGEKDRASSKATKKKTKPKGKKTKMKTKQSNEQSNQAEEGVQSSRRSRKTTETQNEGLSQGVESRNQLEGWQVDNQELREFENEERNQHFEEEKTKSNRVEHSCSFGNPSRGQENVQKQVFGYQAVAEGQSDTKREHLSEHRSNRSNKQKSKEQVKSSSSKEVSSEQNHADEREKITIASQNLEEHTHEISFEEERQDKKAKGPNSLNYINQPKSEGYIGQKASTPSGQIVKDVKGHSVGYIKDEQLKTPKKSRFEEEKRHQGSRAQITTDRSQKSVHEEDKKSAVAGSQHSLGSQKEDSKRSKSRKSSVKGEQQVQSRKSSMLKENYSEQNRPVGKGKESSSSIKEINKDKYSQRERLSSLNDEIGSLKHYTEINEDIPISSMREGHMVTIGDQVSFSVNTLERQPSHDDHQAPQGEHRMLEEFDSDAGHSMSLKMVSAERPKTSQRKSRYHNDVVTTETIQIEPPVLPKFSFAMDGNDKAVPSASGSGLKSMAEQIVKKFKAYDAQIKQTAREYKLSVSPPRTSSPSPEQHVIPEKGEMGEIKVFKPVDRNAGAKSVSSKGEKSVASRKQKGSEQGSLQSLQSGRDRTMSKKGEQERCSTPGSLKNIGK